MAMGTCFDRHWQTAPNGISIFEYPITEKDFPYDIAVLRIAYNHNRDSLALLDVQSRQVCDNVSIGYLRMRDRLGYREYVAMLVWQLESVLGGAAVQWLDAPQPGSANGSAAPTLDIADSDIRPHERFIAFNYTSENIRGLKCNAITLTFGCKRCGHRHRKTVGDKTEIQKDTQTIIECDKCAIHLKIDTRFHLIIVDGANKHNLLRLATFGLDRLAVSGALLNCICDICSKVVVLQPDSKVKCSCGYLLWLKGDNSGAFREVVPLPTIQRRSSSGEDLPVLLKNQGTCKHYRKSTRIFIFPCCSGKYPCDVCHDEKEDHPHTLANRMICGKCGAESNVHPTCSNPKCQASLTGSSSQFWEGGKGSRNKLTMSRKDKKKYTK